MMRLFIFLGYCIPFVTIPVFVVSTILLILTYCVNQLSGQSKKRKRYLSYMLISLLCFLLYFGGILLMLSCVIN